MNVALGSRSIVINKLCGSLASRLTTPFCFSQTSQDLDYTVAKNKFQQLIDTSSNKYCNNKSHNTESYQYMIFILLRQLLT